MSNDARLVHHSSPGEHPGASAQNARAGLWLFAVYLVLYGGFMGLNAFSPWLMAATPFGGVNLAILYGFGLILAALGLALVYMYLCRRIADRTPPDSERIAPLMSGPPDREAAGGAAR